MRLSGTNWIIVEFTLMHSMGSRINLLKRGWSLFCSKDAHGEWRRVGVGLLLAPQLGDSVLEFSPVYKRVASLSLRVGSDCSLRLCTN